MTATVLLVDDDRTLVEMVAFMLKRSGFEPRVAQDGARALEILNSESVDIVVLDVMLPDVDGFEICRRVRAMPRLGHVPILMLSARSQVSDRLEGYEAGADDYVAKPVAIKEIIARIRTLLTRFRRASGTEPRVITFVGAKGGVGNTTLALNVASTLVGNHPKVVLLELGGVGLSGTWMLGLQIRQALLGLAATHAPPYSMEELQTCIHSHRSGLHYIPGHAREASSAGYPPGALAEVLSCLLTDYDVLVVDLGAAMTTSAGEALAQSAVIVPVTEHEGACVWHLRALLEGLERLHLRSKVPGVVLVDRSGSSTATPLSVVAEELGLDVLADIPPAADALHFANSCQQPLCLLRPENPASLVILQLSRRLTSIQVEQPTSSSL